MKRFTLIKKGNEIVQFDFVSDIKNADDAIVIESNGEITVNGCNPITWPTDAKNGLQAIVDVKAGTLRFSSALGPRVLTEFVVSEYVAPFVSVEDCDLAQCDSEIRMFNEKFGDKKPVNPATTKQSAPKGTGNPILGMVLADLTNRALEGKEKYGEPLLANNGRNALLDAYQEALDLAMYLRQAIDEQERS